MNSILYVSESKRQAETISYLGDFRDILLSGETITSQVVTVTVITGTDPSPSSMLYEGIEVHNGNIIEQRIRLGVVGCIYDILFTVGTNLGNTYEKFTRLAILPTDLNANQQHTVFEFTSWNYPYNAGDQLKGFVGFNGGSLWLQPSFEDQMQGGVLLITGSLFQSLTTYTCAPDEMQGGISIISGTLTLVLITYTGIAEAIQGGVAILSGNLFQGGVTYTTPPEAIQGSISISSGTLM